MRRVVIVGPGASGKSTLAAELGQITGLPVIELDKLFWRPGLAATAPGRWAEIQRELIRPPQRAISTYAAGAELHVLPTPHAVRQFLGSR